VSWFDFKFIGRGPKPQQWLFGISGPKKSRIFILRFKWEPCVYQVWCLQFELFSVQRTGRQTVRDVTNHHTQASASVCNDGGLPLVFEERLKIGKHSQSVADEVHRQDLIMSQDVFLQQAHGKLLYVAWKVLRPLWQCSAVYVYRQRQEVLARHLVNET